MKIGLAQILVVPGDIDKNLRRMLTIITQAKKQKIDILVFSEMCVGGYLLGDEWENDTFVDELLEANEILRRESKNICLIWGNVVCDPLLIGEDGRRAKFNAALIAQNKKWLSNTALLGHTFKTLLPKYREFDDARYFLSLGDYAMRHNRSLSSFLQPFEVKIADESVKIALTLCEDMWHTDYVVNPSKILVQHGAQLIFNLSCSPWTSGKQQKREAVIKDLIKINHVPFFYVNNIGVQNNGKNIFLLDGNSCSFDQNATLYSKSDTYKEDVLIIELNSKLEFVNNYKILPKVKNQTEILIEGLCFGIKIFFESIGIQKVVIGLSGGIDSAVVAALLVRSLGKERILGVNMPSVHNSSWTKSAAQLLANNLGIDYVVVGIQASVEQSVQQLEAAEIKNSIRDRITYLPKPHTIHLENMSSRDRGSRVLSAIASLVGGVFTSNGNKTEIALGYCTLYGDVGGALAPIGDLYKGEIYDIARYLNKISPYSVIPTEILNFPPSAELSASQDVSKGLGDPMTYPYHDQLIRAFVEKRWDPYQILLLFQKGELAKKLDIDPSILDALFVNVSDFCRDLEEKWKMYKLSVFKRIQSPPIISVSRRSFGFDLRESQNGVYFTKKYQNLKKLLIPQT